MPIGRYTQCRFVQNEEPSGGFEAPDGLGCIRIATNQIGQPGELLEYPVTEAQPWWGYDGITNRYGRHEKYVYTQISQTEYQQWIVMSQHLGTFDLHDTDLIVKTNPTDMSGTSTGIKTRAVADGGTSQTDVNCDTGHGLPDIPAPIGDSDSESEPFDPEDIIIGNAIIDEAFQNVFEEEPNFRFTIYLTAAFTTDPPPGALATGSISGATGYVVDSDTDIIGQYVVLRGVAPGPGGMWFRPGEALVFSAGTPSSINIRRPMGVIG